MPFAIDEEKMGKLQMLDMANPPTKAIPHLEFPKCIYLHPRKKFKVTRVTLPNGGVVEKTIATEHISKVVKNQNELDENLKLGWRREAYIPADDSAFSMSQEYFVNSPDEKDIEQKVENVAATPEQADRAEGVLGSEIGSKKKK